MITQMQILEEEERWWNCCRVKNMGRLRLLVTSKTAIKGYSERCYSSNWKHVSLRVPLFNSWKTGGYDDELHSSGLGCLLLLYQCACSEYEIVHLHEESLTDILHEVLESSCAV